jgi:hypothetical protein
MPPISACRDILHERPKVSWGFLRELGPSEWHWDFVWGHHESHATPVRMGVMRASDLSCEKPACPCAFYSHRRRVGSPPGLDSSTIAYGLHGGSAGSSGRGSQGPRPARVWRSGSSSGDVATHGSWRHRSEIMQPSLMPPVWHSVNAGSVSRSVWRIRRACSQPSVA